MTNFTQDLKTKPQNTNTEQVMTKAPKANSMMSTMDWPTINADDGLVNDRY